MQKSKVEKMIFISKRLRGWQSVDKGKKESVLRLLLMGFVEEGGKD